MQHPTNLVYLGSNPVDMKSLLLCFCLFAFFTSVAQKVHEVKTDVLMPFIKGAHLSYECIPTGQFGFELEARYRWDVRGEYRIGPPNSTNPLIDYHTYFIDADQQALTLTFAIKYYFLNEHDGNGLYAGAYLRNDILTTRKIDFHETLVVPEYEYNTTGKPEEQGERHLRNGLGILSGYKFMLAEHFFLEFALGFDLNMDTWFRSENRKAEVACIPTLKAGYRF